MSKGLKIQNKIFVGIDEVGRGPLAGPVAVGAFVWFGKRFPKELEGIKDSKKLSEKKREEWFAKIIQFKKEDKCNFKVEFKSAKYIDKYGISKAIRECLKSAISSFELDPKKVYVLLDGGLRAPEEFTQQETIIKGDTKESLISAAAIMAKVTRDRQMVKLSNKYPNYGFDIHKGYGTLFHRTSILKNGISKEHRRTFIKI
ncbi:MAG: ribonuclease HII [bacterium]